MKPLSENGPQAKPPPTAERQGARGDWARATRGLGRVVEQITPWLLDLGSWIFGALIAVNLIILGALLTVGPVDLPVKISTVALALALPTDVAGFVLVRLVTDLSKAGVADVATQAMLAEGYSVEEAIPREAREKKLRRSTLLYSYVLLGPALLLTLTGVTAALWHMGWWIGIAFVAMVMASQVVIVLALSTMGSGGRWRTPSGEAENRPRSRRRSRRRSPRSPPV